MAMRYQCYISSIYFAFLKCSGIYLMSQQQYGEANTTSCNISPYYTIDLHGNNLFEVDASIL